MAAVRLRLRDWAGSAAASATDWAGAWAWAWAGGFRRGCSARCSITGAIRTTTTPTTAAVTATAATRSLASSRSSTTIPSRSIPRAAASGRNGRQSGHDRLRQRSRGLQGRRLRQGTRPGRPGPEDDAQRRDPARVSRLVPLRAQAVRRGRRRALCRVVGRPRLGLDDPDQPVRRPGNLHAAAPGARELLLAESAVGGGPIRAGLPLPDPGTCRGGRPAVQDRASLFSPRTSSRRS